MTPSAAAARIADGIAVWVRAVAGRDPPRCRDRILCAGSPISQPARPDRRPLLAGRIARSPHPAPAVAAPMCAETYPLPATITLRNALARRDSLLLPQLGCSAAGGLRHFVARAHERVHLGQCGRGYRGGPGVAVAEHLAQVSRLGG